MFDQPHPGMMGPGLRGQGARGKKWNFYQTVKMDFFHCLLIFQLELHAVAQASLEHKCHVAQVSLELMAGRKLWASSSAITLYLLL